MKAFNTNVGKISSLLTTLYFSQVAQPEEDSTFQTDYALVPPLKLLKVSPSTAPNKTCEEIKSIIKELLIEIIVVLSKNSEKTSLSAPQMEPENRLLKQEVKNLKIQLEKVTASYFKELNTLREQMFRRRAENGNVEISVRFFKIEDGLSPKSCTLLNNRIKEIKDGIEEKIKRYNDTLNKMSKEIRRYELLTPEDYPLAKIDLGELFSKVKGLYDKDTLWEGLSRGMKPEYIAGLIDEKYGRASSIPKEIICQEIAKAKNEMIKLIKEKNIALNSQVQSLEEQLKNLEKSTEYSHEINTSDVVNMIM